MTEKLKVLDLFAGIGGFSLGLERTGGFETVAFCEIDKYCQKILKKHWPEVPIFNDVRDLNYEGPVDVITGGYPCQPFSVAGKRKGTKDDRHLWPFMFSLIKKYRPTWVIGENVAGHINMGLDITLTNLESEGYETMVFIIPAVSVDAKHRRDRLWIISYRRCEGIYKSRVFGDVGKKDNPRRNERYGLSGIEEKKAEGSREDVCNTTSQGLQDGGISQVGEQEKKQEFKRPDSYVSNSDNDNGKRKQPKSINKEKRKVEGERPFGPQNSINFEKRCKWPVEPSVGRVVNGLSGRVDRIKGLGNAVVPQIPEIIGHAILESIST